MTEILKAAEQTIANRLGIVLMDNAKLDALNKALQNEIIGLKQQIEQLRSINSEELPEFMSKGNTKKQ